MKIAYTDGGCSGNPGPGGYGLAIMNEKEDEVLYVESKRTEKTTNNREELKAILAMFTYVKNLNDKEPFIIYSDSAYCVNACNDWIYGWEKKGWTRGKGKEVKNLDLMKELFDYLTSKELDYKIIKVKGHAGHIGNELADALATSNKVRADKLIEQVEKRG